MSATDNAERGGAVEGAGLVGISDVTAAGVNQPGVFFSLFGGGTHAYHTVLGLENDMYAFRQIVGDKCRKSDTKIDDITVFKLFGSTTGDKGFNFAFFHSYYYL